MKKRWLALGAVVVVLMLVVLQAWQWQNQEKHRQLKFGATYMTMNNPYFAVLDENIKEVVESNGDILITRDPLQDQEKQNEQIKDMIEEGIDVLFLNPVNWREVKPAVEMCKEAGVPIFVVDTNVYEEEQEDIIISTILSDNYNAGVQCANNMMKKMEQADIVILNDDDVNSTNRRVQGFLDTIEGHNQYRVVSHRTVRVDLELAMEEMKQIINSGVRFDVVLGGNDPLALGCLAAMQMLHVEENVLLYGIDGSPDAKAMIRAGYMDATSAQSPISIGNVAAEKAYDYLAGKAVAPTITIPVTLITSDNLKNYDMAGWQ